MFHLPPLFGLALVANASTPYGRTAVNAEIPAHMAHRRVHGLRAVRLLPRRPAHIPRQRWARGAKAAGLRYEAAVAAAMGGKHGLWFEFEDDNGLGWCSPDIVLQGDGHLVVLECKLTDTPEGKTQISQLYRPVLERAFRCSVFGVVVAKNLTPLSDPLTTVAWWDDALELASAEGGAIPTWHCPWPSRATYQLTEVKPTSRALDSTVGRP